MSIISPIAAAVARRAVFWLMPPGHEDSNPYWMSLLRPTPPPPSSPELPVRRPAT